MAAEGTAFQREQVLSLELHPTCRWNELDEGADHGDVPDQMGP